KDAENRVAESAAEQSAAINVEKRWEQVATELRFTPPQRAAVDAELQRLRKYLALRETAKHWLMLGYALIRQVLLEVDHRFELDGGIFYLTLDELPHLQSMRPDELRTRIAARRRRYDIALSLNVPQVLFSDDLEAIGRDATVSSAGSFQGVGLSA